MLFSVMPVMAQSEEADMVLARINSANLSEYGSIIDEYHSIIFDDESVYDKYMTLSGSEKNQVFKELYTRAPFAELNEFSRRVADAIEKLDSTSSNTGSSSGGGGGSAVEAGVVLSEVCGKPGETVEITLDINENTGFSNLGLEISYDSSVLTLVSVSENEEVDAIFTAAESIDANPYNVAWDSEVNVCFNGTLATFTFKIADDAAVGDYPVELSFYKGREGDYIDGEDVNYDETETPLCLSYESGLVSVYTHVPGDIDGDGIVNNKDATYMLRYLAGWNIEDINTIALDTTGDGRVNNKDGTRLLRYLVQGDVEIY